MFSKGIEALGDADTSALEKYLLRTRAADVAQILLRQLAERRPLLHRCLASPCHPRGCHDAAEATEVCAFYLAAADVSRGSRVPAQDVARVSPVPAQDVARASPVPAQMWHG